MIKMMDEVTLNTIVINGRKFMLEDDAAEQVYKFCLAQTNAQPTGANLTTSKKSSRKSNMKFYELREEDVVDSYTIGTGDDPLRFCLVKVGDLYGYCFSKACYIKGMVNAVKQTAQNDFGATWDSTLGLRVFPNKTKATAFMKAQKARNKEASKSTK